MDLVTFVYNPLGKMVSALSTSLPIRLSKEST